MNKIKSAGFTLVEIMIVITILVTLSAITYSIAVPNWRARSHYVASVAELNAIGNAVQLYVGTNNDYPADVSRGILPVGLGPLLQKDGMNGSWPTPPYPGAVYDYDYTDSPERIVQVSLRYCDAGDTATCKKNFPREDFVTDAWDSNSSIYYCIKGPCRAHFSQPAEHPGYCINCGNKARVY